MLNLDSHVKYSKKHQYYIKELGIPEYKHWDSGKKINKEIKKSIKDQLLVWQENKCAYCGLLLGGTSREEIEHIAPRHIYPQFEYITKNLVISCQYCNSSSKKGRKNTVEIQNTYYNKCIFSIVHPYYDDVDRFFERMGAIISVSTGLSADEEKKAQNTIDMFGLSENCHVEMRAKELCLEKIKEDMLCETNEELLDKISRYI